MSEATRPHRNHGLFSDHYLNVTLPERPEWKGLVEQARTVREGISDLFTSFTPSSNEAQTERDLIRPILKLLGHDYEVQPALETPDGTKRPDYVFYRDAASLNANKNRTLNDELLRSGAFAVGDAKYWDRPLDVSLKGRNEAFLIDTPTKERLVREDPRSAEIIKPYLRGQNIKRWSPEWNGLWMIVLKSSGDHHWPWSNAGENAEEVFERTYRSLYGHMKLLEDRLRKRQDKGQYWWELRSCAYYDAFEQPKVMYQEIQFHPQ